MTSLQEVQHPKPIKQRIYFKNFIFVDFFRLEIQIKAEAWVETQARNDRDIYEMGVLTFLAQQNPKAFPKSLHKFRPSRVSKKLDDRERQAMKEEGAKVGMRVPT
jgi:hypothetical protein